ncbi:MAG: glycosyl hydrolase [Marinilabiliales bacterium]|nr:MAG: glycosyl hydrolase [Marinilabiliales bacterium]
MRYIYIALILLLAFKIDAQIAWLEPTNPKPSDNVTLYFDATKGNTALKEYEGTVYMHTGVITDKSLDGGDWKHVVGNWGEDDERVKMTNEGDGIHSISFVMNDFYNLRDDETPKMLAFVFRSENGGLVAKTKTNEDIFIPVNDYVIRQKQEADYLFDKRSYVSHFKYGNALKILTTKGLVKIIVYSDKIIEVRHFEKSIENEVNSDAVIMKQQETFSELSDSEEHLVLNVNDLEVVAHKDPFSLSFKYKGKEILKEEIGYFKREDNNGLRFNYDKEEKLFGLGERANSFNLVGARYKLYNRPKYGYEYGARNINYSIPLLVSSKKYLLLFDNPQKGYADIGETEDGILEWGAIGGLMKYYVVVGDDFKDVMHNYGELTGKQPLPPLWALGNLQSRMAYRTQYETDSIISLMQKNDFPLDAVILDFYWFGDSILGTMGRLKWYKPNWPEPGKMISDFKNKGVKTILITEPYILDSLENFKIADSLGILAKDSLGNSYVNKEFYFGAGALIDIFKQSAQDWFWQQYQKQIEKGVAGWWGDLGEPENHPSDQIHINGMADEVHNIYGHYWHKMLFENYRKYYPNTRLFNLNRAGYAGSQRYSIYPWTGDVARSWGGLKAQIPLMLNMSMSGLPFIHSDAGGFAQGTKDDELYTRWLQMSCFSPILRPHGSGIPSEAVYFNDTTQTIVRNYMKLRYSLLPYIYNVAAAAHIKGYPIVRPLFFEFPDDSETYNANWEYMFGESLLVAPIVEKGQDTIKVYLPQGYDWYDFHTNKKFDGGQWIKQKVELENIPIFVKSGSFISMVEPVNSTDNYKTDILIIKYYLVKAGSNSEQKLYLDDGKTFGNYEKGNYSELLFKSNSSKDGIELEFSADDHKYKGMPSEREIKLVLVGYDTDKKSLGAKLLMNDGSSKKIKFKKENNLFVTYLKQDNKSLKIEIE